MFFYVIVFLDNKYFNYIILLIYISVLYEWLNLNNGKKKTADFIKTLFLYSLLIYYLISFPAIYKFLLFFVLFFIFYISVAIFFYPNYYFSWKSVIFRNIVGFLIIPVSATSLIIMHSVHYNLILFVFIIAWLFDAFSYIIGSLFGENKFNTSITPKKTIEGFIGGFFLTNIFFFILKGTSYYSFFSWLLIYVLVFFSIIGDLLESIYKRISNKKDSGFILPGHGGFMDRMDSICITTIIMYYIYLHKIYHKYLFII